MPDLSITELMECPRALWLKKKKDFYVKPSSAYWAFRGQMAHSIMEAGALPDDLVEKRLYATLGGYRVSGQYDLIRPPKIIDYKTCKKVPGDVNPNHRIQLSCYRWLSSQQPDPVTITHGEICYMDMSQHITLQVSLMSLEETEAWMKERLVTLSEIIAKDDEAPKFENHFNPRNWKCGNSEQWSYCEVRKLCTHGQGLTEEEPKPRKVKASSR